VLCGAWCGGAARGGVFFVGFLLSIINYQLRDCARHFFDQFVAHIQDIDSK
jgi:hypothetical protein